jgi:hypothetical protein
MVLDKGLEDAKECLRDLFRQYQDEGLPPTAVMSIRRRMKEQLGFQGKFRSEKLRNYEEVDLVRNVLTRRYVRFLKTGR